MFYLSLPIATSKTHVVPTLVRTASNVPCCHQRLCMAMLCLLLLFWPVLLHAHAGESHREDIEVAIVTPAEGAVLTEDFLQIFVTFSSETEGALDTLDHLHYGIGLQGSGEAQLGEFTMPDLTGRVEIYLANPEENGTYEICTWLAEADHSHLSETVCSTFVLATSGITVYEPKDNTSSKVNDITVEFESYGSAVSSIEYSVDQGVAQTVSAQESPYTIGPLANGDHTITIKALNDESLQLGDTVTRKVTINSALTLKNLKKLNRFVKKCQQDAFFPLKDLLLKRSIRLAKKMQAGGTRSAESSALTSDAIKSIRRKLKKMKTSFSSRKLKSVSRSLKALKERSNE